MCLLNKSSVCLCDDIILLALDLNLNNMFIVSKLLQVEYLHLSWTPSFVPPSIFLHNVTIFQSRRQEIWTISSIPISEQSLWQANFTSEMLCILSSKCCVSYLSFAWPQWRSLLFLAWIVAIPVIGLYSHYFSIQPSHYF